jgi:anti-anti-sigma factor
VIAAGQARGDALITLDPDFSITTEQRGDTLLIRIAGPFDLGAVGRVENAVDRALRPPAQSILFDLGDATFLDMAGLGTIIRAHNRAQAAATAVQIVPPVGLARRVFTLTRVGDYLTLIKDVPPAPGV